jgi:hypothetical protein
MEGPCSCCNLTSSVTEKGFRFLRGPCSVFPPDADALLALARQHGYRPEASSASLRMRFRHRRRYESGAYGLQRMGDWTRPGFKSDKECFERMAETVRELQTLEDPKADAHVVITFILWGAPPPPRDRVPTTSTLTFGGASCDRPF